MEITLNLTSEDRGESYTSAFALLVVDTMDQVLREYYEKGEYLNGALFRAEVLHRLQERYNPMSTVMLMLVFRLVDVFITSYNRTSDDYTGSTKPLYS